MKDRYTVVYDTNINGLITEVNEYISRGWLPQGSVTVDVAAFYQAMILPTHDSTVNGMLGVKISKEDVGG